MMKCNGARLALVVLCLALAATSGCRRRPAAQAVDPDKAREVLRTTLTAWQKGESPDALRQQWPAIAAADPKWQNGHRLLRYAIADKDQVVGGDLRCSVVLVLKGPDGKQTEEKAVFSVSTAPALVVVRADN
jgi:hypothetical protein